MLRLPVIRPAMYSTLPVVLTAGFGPSGLAFDMPPLPLAISSLRPSGVTRTEVGYQPLGMKPSDRLLPGSATSNTATAFSVALATNSSLSSGERARPAGGSPGGRLGGDPAAAVSAA